MLQVGVEEISAPQFDMETAFAVHNQSRDALAEASRGVLNDLWNEWHEHLEAGKHYMSARERLTDQLLKAVSEVVAVEECAVTAAALVYWASERVDLSPKAPDAVLAALIKSSAHVTFSEGSALAMVSKLSTEELDGVARSGWAAVYPESATYVAEMWEALLHAASSDVTTSSLFDIGVISLKLEDLVVEMLRELKTGAGELVRAVARGVACIHMCALLTAHFGASEKPELTIEEACAELVSGTNLEAAAHRLAAVASACTLDESPLPTGEGTAFAVLHSLFIVTDTSNEDTNASDVEGLQVVMEELNSMCDELRTESTKEAQKNACRVLAHTCFPNRTPRDALDWPMMPLANENDANEPLPNLAVRGFFIGMKSGSIRRQLTGRGVVNLVVALALVDPERKSSPAAPDLLGCTRAATIKATHLAAFPPMHGPPALATSLDGPVWTDFAVAMNEPTFAAAWRTVAASLAEPVEWQRKLPLALARKAVLEACVEASEPVNADAAAAAFSRYFEIEAKIVGDSYTFPYHPHNLNSLRAGDIDTAAFFLYILRFWDGVAVTPDARALGTGHLEELTSAMLSAEVALLKYMSSVKPPAAPGEWPAKESLTALSDTLIAEACSKKVKQTASEVVRAWNCAIPPHERPKAGKARGSVDNLIQLAAAGAPAAAELHAAARAAATLIRRSAILKNKNHATLSLPLTRFEWVTSGTAVDCLLAVRTCLPQICDKPDLLLECARLEVLAYAARKVV